MNLSQQKIIENYTSLKSKVNTKKLGTILAFCIYFQSDNIELYQEFEEIYSDMYFGAINIKALNFFLLFFSLKSNEIIIADNIIKMDPII